MVGIGEGELVPRPLPAELSGRPFSVGDGLARGLPRGRMSEGDLVTPFKGVRMSSAIPYGPRELAAAFALRRPAGHVISHTTALLLWGAPLPRRVEEQARLHVSAFDGVTPRAVRTTGHTLDASRTGVSALNAVPLTDPASSWVLSAPLLDLDDLVAAGDFLVTGSEPFDRTPPLTSTDALAAVVDAHAGARGIRRAREALGFIRYGSLSRQETFMRLMLERAGLPEPELNYSVAAPDGGKVAMVDLAYPGVGVAVEFESLLHQSPAKFRRDIRKQQELEAIGWKLHRLTSDDVDPRLRTPMSRAAANRVSHSLAARETAHPKVNPPQ